MVLIAGSMKRVRGVDVLQSQVVHESQKSKVVERKLKRRQVVAENFPVPANISYLEARSVKAPTIRDYCRRYSEFQSWMNLHQLSPHSSLELDDVLVEFLQELFDHQRGVNDGVRAVAAVKFHMAHLAMHIPRTTRALKGWHHAAPPQQRMPVPIEVVGAIIGWDLLAPTSSRVKSSIVHPVHDLHEARRMQCTVGKAVGGSSEILESGIHFLGGVTPSSRGLNPRQDKSIRQFSHHRLGRVDQPISDETGKRKIRDISFVDNQSQRVSKPVCSSIPSSQTAKSRSDTVCSETWGCNSRCAVKAEEHVGSEAERKVGNRHFIETIHQRGKIANRVKQGARSCQRVWSKDHAKPAAVVGQPVIDSADTVWNSSITKRMIGRAIKKNKGPRSLSGSSLLKKLFREALKNCNGKFHGVFLDIFSGDGGVSQYLKKRGFPVVSIDICDDPRFDVLDPAVVAVIVGWIKSKCVLGVWLATPCTSWSRARHGPINSNWGPIRSNQFVYGFKNLSDKDLTKVTIGNKTMRFTAHIISNCIHFKTPCFLENPATSMLWRAPPIVKCCSHVSSSTVPGGARGPRYRVGLCKITHLSLICVRAEKGSVLDLFFTISCFQDKTLSANNFGLTLHSHTQRVLLVLPLMPSSNHMRPFILSICVDTLEFNCGGESIFLFGPFGPAFQYDM